MSPMTREPLPQTDPLLLTQALTWILVGRARTDRELEIDRDEQTKRNITQWHSPDGPHWLLPLLDSMANGSAPKGSRQPARKWLKKHGLTLEAGVALMREAITAKDRTVEGELVFHRLLFTGCAKERYRLYGLRHAENSNKSHVEYEPIPASYFMRNPVFCPGRGYYGHGELSSVPQPEELLDSIFSRSVEADRSPVYLAVKISREDTENLSVEVDRELMALAREHIRNRIEICDITPDEGEAECQRLGLAPLNPQPDPLRFDPMRLDDWTFAMAIAWIASRDVDLVRQFWDAYRAELFYWTPQVTPDPARNGKPRRTVHLFPARPAQGSYEHLQFLADLATGFKISPAEAKADLWRKLQAERLTADAVPVETGKRVPIPGREFRDLEIVSDRGGEDRLASTASRLATLDVSYLKPFLRRQDVVQLWERPLNDDDLKGIPPRVEEVSAQGGRRQHPVSRRPSFQKIAAAIAAEEMATGKPFPALRAVERDKRLADRMRTEGLKEQEIPGGRTFRAYFNEGPGKPAKPG